MTMRQLLIPVLALGFFFGLKLPIPAQEDARGILTSHVHMTQNRLGVGAGQEAHISATLLKLLT